jgi:hypothetical protein
VIATAQAEQLAEIYMHDAPSRDLAAQLTAAFTLEAGTEPVPTLS